MSQIVNKHMALVRPAITPYIKTKQMIETIVDAYCLTVSKLIDKEIDSASTKGRFQTKIEMPKLDVVVSHHGIYKEIVECLGERGYSATMIFHTSNKTYSLTVTWEEPPAKDFLLDGKQYQEAITEVTEPKSNTLTDILNARDQDPIRHSISADDDDTLPPDQVGDEAGAEDIEYTDD